MYMHTSIQIKPFGLTNRPTNYWCTYSFIHSFIYYVDASAVGMPYVLTDIHMYVFICIWVRRLSRLHLFCSSNFAFLFTICAALHIEVVKSRKHQKSAADNHHQPTKQWVNKLSIRPLNYKQTRKRTYVFIQLTVCLDWQSTNLHFNRTGVVENASVNCSGGWSQACRVGNFKLQLLNYIRFYVPKRLLVM